MNAPHSRVNSAFALEHGGRGSRTRAAEAFNVAETTDDSVTITTAGYGKAGVEVLTWIRDGTSDFLRDSVIRVDVEGDFLSSYRTGDNSAILPSDSLRRHALDECGHHRELDIAELLLRIASRVLAANPAFTSTSVSADCRQWDRLGDHSFTAAQGTVNSSVALRTGGDAVHTGGVEGVELLLTTGSAFTGFLRDPLTTQQESADRPLRGALSARWTHAASPTRTDDEICRLLLAGLVDRPSKAVQEWLTAGGTALLGATPDLTSVTLRFASASLGPLPVEFAPDGCSYEVPGGSTGVTEVTLTSPRL
jgi:urate oxidase